MKNHDNHGDDAGENADDAVGADDDDADEDDDDEDDDGDDADEEEQSVGLCQAHQPHLSSCPALQKGDLLIVLDGQDDDDDDFFIMIPWVNYHFQSLAGVLNKSKNKS